MGAMFLTLLALAAPHPGQHVTIDVSVATLWQTPNSPRTIDAPALGNPVDLDAWNRNLASTSARAGLGGRVVTQALYGEKVTVLAVRGSWAKVAVPDQPSPLDRHGYPGWLPLRQLKTVVLRGSQHLVLKVKKAEVRVGGHMLELSYGTTLPLIRWSGDFAYVRTPDGVGRVVHEVGWFDWEHRLTDSRRSRGTIPRDDGVDRGRVWYEALGRRLVGAWNADPLAAVHEHLPLDATVTWVGFDETNGEIAATRVAAHLGPAHDHPEITVIDIIGEGAVVALLCTMARGSRRTRFTAALTLDESDRIASVRLYFDWARAADVTASSPAAPA